MTKTINVRKRTGSMDIQKELRKTERHPYFNVTLVSDDTINISGRKSIRRNKFERKAYALKRPLLKTLFFIGMMCFIFGCLFIFVSMMKTPVNAKERQIEDYLTGSIQVIGCYNDRTKETREATKCTKGGDHNIMLPPKSHIKHWRKVFENEKQIINRLVIVNFESGFKEEAQNKFARGYVQTLRKWGISPKIEPQLEWMNNRQISQKDKKRCGRYWKQDNKKDGFEAGEDGVMACLYRYHYHAYKGVWYSKRAMKVREFYINYLK